MPSSTHCSSWKLKLQDVSSASFASKRLALPEKSAVHVLWSTVPVGRRPFAFWKSITVVSVTGPYQPSPPRARAFFDMSIRRFCSVRTFPPFMRGELSRRVRRKTGADKPGEALSGLEAGSGVATGTGEAAGLRVARGAATAPAAANGLVTGTLITTRELAGCVGAGASVRFRKPSGVGIQLNREPGPSPADQAPYRLTAALNHRREAWTPGINST